MYGSSRIVLCLCIFLMLCEAMVMDIILGTSKAGLVGKSISMSIRPHHHDKFCKPDLTSASRNKQPLARAPYLCQFQYHRRGPLDCILLVHPCH